VAATAATTIERRAPTWTERVPDRRGTREAIAMESTIHQFAHPTGVILIRSMNVIVARNLCKTYTGSGRPVAALRGVDLTVASGELVAVMGPSGCGKSTLLHLCGAMDQATDGDLDVLGLAVRGLDDDRLTELRRRRIGFVFQLFNLLPTLTVAENIALPLMLAGIPHGEARDRARREAGRVGIEHRVDSYPGQLSGGEMQRTAIARAVVHEPGLVIADEPTGNLDTVAGAQVLDLLEALNRRLGVTLVLATHDAAVAARATRIVRMRDGRLETDRPVHESPERATV